MERRFERTDGEHPIGLAGIEALVRARTLDGVTHLVLRGQAIGDEGLALVLDALDLSLVEELDVSGCDIASEGALRLAAATGLSHLRVLHVGFDSISAEAIVALVSAPQLHMLEHLSLSMNAMSQRVAEAIVRSPFASTLESLIANDTMSLDDSFVETLAGGVLPRLASLGIGWHRHVTDRSALALADRSAFPSLRFLQVEGCSIGAAGHAALIARGLEELQIDPPWVDPHDGRVPDPGEHEPF